MPIKLGKYFNHWHKKWMKIKHASMSLICSWILNAWWRTLRNKSNIRIKLKAWSSRSSFANAGLKIVTMEPHCKPFCHDFLGKITFLLKPNCLVFVVLYNNAGPSVSQIGGGGVKEGGEGGLDGDVPLGSPNHDPFLDQNKCTSLSIPIFRKSRQIIFWLLPFS